jgi:hypothetical protein
VIDVEDATGGSCSPARQESFWWPARRDTGYLAEPGLSADVFVEKAGRRYYRTGDRVVRRVDGTLEFLGRVDRQVNIRGHRVEPEEIEVVLGATLGRARGRGDRTAPGRAPRLWPTSNRAGSTARPDGRRAPGPFRASRRPPSRLHASGPDSPHRFHAPHPDGKGGPHAAASSQPAGTPLRPERVGAPVVTPTERLLADVWCDILAPIASSDMTTSSPRR